MLMLHNGDYKRILLVCLSILPVFVYAY